MPLPARPAFARSPFAALATALILAAPGAQAASGTLPGVLTLIQSNARVQWGGPGLGQNSLNDPTFADIATGAADAETDALSGTVKARSIDSGNTSGILTYAYGNFEVLFQNTGPVAIGFGAGAINATVNASFARTLGSDAFGTASQLLTASLYGQGGGLNSGAGVSYRAAEFNRSSSPTLDFDLNPNAGFTATGAADLASLAVALAFPAFSLEPGQTLRVGLNLTTNAWGYAPGGGPWSATTDAFNTATIAMALPEGVRLESAQPLAWVTQVPEPATYWLLLAGLLGLAGWRSRLRHRRRWLRPALLALAGAGLAGASHAQLVVVDHEVVLQLRGPGLPATTPRAPWTLSDTAGTAAGSSFASGSLLSGDFKVESNWTGSVDSALVQQARMLARIGFRNDFGFDLVFPAGAIDVDLNGSFGGGPGSESFGFSNQLYSRLTVTAPAFAGSPGGVSNSLLVYDQNQVGFDTTQVATPAGAGVTVRSASAGALDATLSAAGFTLAPGQTVTLAFTFEAQSRGTNGWSAFVDAGNSAQLSMRLPAGTTLSSPQPLAWVTEVPEPATVWAMLAGLALMAARARRARAPGTRPSLSSETLRQREQAAVAAWRAGTRSAA